MNEEALAATSRAGRGIEERIAALLGQMTLEEKVAMVAGSGPWHSTGVERLGVPPIKVTDGPNGARGDARSGATAACFPAGSALAATWNPELVEQVGSALGEEAKTKGAQVLLGPTVNIHRHPLGGRHFEAYSEDPHLTSRIAVAFVRGVQSRGVGTSVKHFVCNDSEYERHTISSEVAERPLREIYLAPFEAAVREADPWTIMSAYNRVNGTWASENARLLTGILREEWGYRGFVVSDWGGAHDAAADTNAGLDLEMPGPARVMGEKLLAAVRAGEVAEKTVDEKVRRLLRVTILSGRLDAPGEQPERSVDDPAHRALARRAATESMVLLRNERALPFDVATLRSVAVIGPNARAGQIQGGGSAGVAPHYAVHPLEALTERLGAERVVYEPGCRIDKYVRPFAPDSLRPASGEDRPGLTLEYWNGTGFSGDPALSRVVRRSAATWMGPVAPGVDPRRFSARYSGTFTPSESGAHTFGLMSAGRARMSIDGRIAVDNWSEQVPGDSFFGSGSSERRERVELRAGEPYALSIEFERDAEHLVAGLQFGVLPPFPDDAMARAVDAARQADAAVVVVGTSSSWETEGNDRTDLALPGAQDDLIGRVCAANPRTVVVVNAGSPMGMDWQEQAGAVLQVWFPGQEFGNALADLLLGDESPSGRLPTTFPFRLEDTPAFTSYPGENGEVRYGEGLFVGYRWYDRRDIAPRFPFGHGLGYAAFAYGPLSVAPECRAGEPIEVSLDVSNTGDRAAAEVVQLYVKDLESRLERPDKELAGFAKPVLQPGESTTVRFALDARSLSYWDPAAPGWVAEPGEFELLVGASSRDIRSRARFTLVEP